MKPPARLVLASAAALALAGAPTAAVAQETPQGAPAGSPFSEAQLEQMAAPIALYPDSLLMQILMASTYPLEIVQAQRWYEKQGKPSGTALDEALKEQGWDPSVKSLCTFPDVLQRMSENLDWTQDLGDAFLGQEAALLDAVQKMRGKAKEAGNLETTQEQTVTVQQDNIIVIESSDPDVVYVPSYSPAVVYGPAWSYPSWYYPPLYAPPPPGWGLLSFSAGVIVGGALWGGCNWGWGHSEVDIDVDHNYKFNEKTSKNPERQGSRDRSGARDGKSKWQHDPSHRKGVNYRDGATARKFGGTGSSSRVTRDQARGHDRSGPGAGRGASGTRDVARPSASATPRGGARPTSNRPAATPSSARASSRGSAGGGSALSGSRQASFDRAASSRGSASRGGGSSRGSSGSRGGGGRGGGRGRR